MNDPTSTESLLHEPGRLRSLVRKLGPDWRRWHEKADLLGERFDAELMAALNDELLHVDAVLREVLPAAPEVGGFEKRDLSMWHGVAVQYRDVHEAARKFGQEPQVSAVGQLFTWWVLRIYARPYPVRVVEREIAAPLLLGNDPPPPFEAATKALFVLTARAELQLKGLGAPKEALEAFDRLSKALKGDGDLLAALGLAIAQYDALMAATGRGESEPEPVDEVPLSGGERRFLSLLAEQPQGAALNGEEVVAQGGASSQTDLTSRVVPGLRKCGWEIKNRPRVGYYLTASDRARFTRLQGIPGNAVGR